MKALLLSGITKLMPEALFYCPSELLTLNILDLNRNIKS